MLDLDDFFEYLIGDNLGILGVNFSIYRIEKLVFFILAESRTIVDQITSSDIEGKQIHMDHDAGGIYP